METGLDASSRTEGMCIMPVVTITGAIHGDELIVAEMDLDLIEEVRRTWQFYRDRRPETYGAMTELLP